MEALTPAPDHRIIAHNEAIQYAASPPGQENARHVNWHENIELAKAEWAQDIRAGIYSSRLIQRAIRISPWKEYEKPEQE